MEWFKNIFLNFKNILIIILICVLGFLIFQNRAYEKEASTNYVILTDSLLEYKNKNNQLYKEKESYILEIEELKRTNSSLYNEYKSLKDNPIVITEVITEVQIKEIFVESESKVDSLSKEIINKYDYIDDYLKLNATHKYSFEDNNGSLFLSNIKMCANLYTDIIEKDKKIYLISRSDNPYLQISNINGGFIELNDSKTLNKYFKRNNKWSVSVSGGIYAIYGLNNKKVDVGPGMGLSISYSLFSW